VTFDDPKVGINTNSPSSKFHLNGVFTIDDQSSDPSSNGEYSRNGSDVKVYSGGAVRNLSDIGGGGASPLDVDNLYYVVHERLAGTNCGSASSGRQTRVLDTERVNNISNATLNSSTISIPSGDYWVEASAPAYAVNRHKIIFRNTSDNTDSIIGSSEYANNSQTRSFLSGKISIGGTKHFELKHYTESSNSSNGLGVETNEGTVEVYSVVKIWKI